jgi:hypothetical protein
MLFFQIFSLSFLYNFKPSVLAAIIILIYLGLIKQINMAKSFHLPTLIVAILVLTKYTALHMNFIK